MRYRENGSIKTETVKNYSNDNSLINISVKDYYENVNRMFEANYGTDGMTKDPFSL